MDLDEEIIEEIKEEIREEIRIHREMIEDNKMEKRVDNETELKGFVEKHECDKKGISEKDQYFMVMQLLQCAYDAEIKKTNEESRQLVEHRWKLIRKYIKDLWDITLYNKYQVVMARVTTLNIWGVAKKNVQNDQLADSNDCPSDSYMIM